MAGEIADRWHWADGSSDPVERALHLKYEPDQVKDPRLRETPQICLADQIEITITDPAQIMEQCEQQDEEQGVPKGTNFNLYIQLNSTCTR